MIDNFDCAVCNSLNWRQIEPYTYPVLDTLDQGSKSRPRRIPNRAGLRALLFARPRKGLIRAGELNRYQRLRREVLSHIWFNSVEEVELVVSFCKVCGFVCYSPRPGEDDIRNKYEYLKSRDEDIGGQAQYSAMGIRLDRQRASRVQQACARYTSKDTLNVLDYGGGNGKLLVPFRDRGHLCHIIDYNESPIQGVKKVADDINQLKVSKRFDVIICSHVLEHVSEPGSLLRKLGELLEDKGIVYGEVPQEIWAGLKIDADPVTHINFFTRNSFANLFLQSGFELSELHEEVSSYGEGFMPVVWLVATKRKSGEAKLLPPDVEAYLYPKRIKTLTRFLRIKYMRLMSRLRAEKTDV